MKLFTAGPVSVSESMKKIDYDPIGHREEEFSELFSRVKARLLKIFKGDPRRHTVLIINGSGTAAIESVLASVIGDERILVVTNGAFGDRLEEICRFHALNCQVVRFGWDEPINVDVVAKRMEHQSAKPTFLAMVHHETSTGALNPIHQVGELCKKRNVSFIVDSISGFCGAPLNVIGDHIDFAISNTNKCLCGLPVLSFLCVRNATLEKCRQKAKPKNYYLNLFKHYDYAQKDQTPNTPQIPLFHMLDKAIDELFVEGLDNRLERYASNAKLLRSLLKSAGFEFYLEESQMGNIVTNVLVPNGISYQQIHDEMKNRGYLIYPGKGHLEGKVINLGHVGFLTKRDIYALCDDFIDVVAHAS